MMTTLHFQVAQLLVTLILLPSCLAQDNNDTAWCPDVSALFNSSGQTSFQIASASDENWYMSLAIQDWRSPVLLEQTQDVKAYISHPESTMVNRGCFYQFNGINASASGTGANGCEGVLSDECMDALRDISFPVVSIRGSKEGLQCERIDSDRLRDACPEEMLSPGTMNCKCFSTFSSTTRNPY
jgi:hypothetical protein